jgi:hypothetical protein
VLDRPFFGRSMNAPNTASCPHCKSVLRLTADGQMMAVPTTGQKLRCPLCGAVFTILPASLAPSDASMVAVKSMPSRPAVPQSAQQPQPRQPPAAHPFKKTAFCLGRAITAGAILICGILSCVCSAWVFNRPTADSIQRAGEHPNGTAKHADAGNVAGDKQRHFTAPEILALQRSDPARFRETLEGKTVTVQGTVYGPAIHLGQAICIQLEGSHDLTHGAQNVMVIFRQTDERRFTPKFQDWAMSRLPGDHIEVFGTVRADDPKHEIPITIWEAKLAGF